MIRWVEKFKYKIVCFLFCLKASVLGREDGREKAKPYYITTGGKKKVTQRFNKIRS